MPPEPKDESKQALAPRAILRHLRELMRPRRGQLALGLGLLTIGRLCGLVLPWATKTLIDDVVGKREQDLLLPLVIATGSAVAVQGLCSYALVQLLSKSAQQLIAELRIKVQRHVGRLPVAYYDKTKSGTLVSRIMNDVEGVRNLVGTGLVELIGGSFTAVIAFGLLLHINWRLTLATLVLLAVFALFLFKAFQKIRPIFRERGKITGEVTGRLTESLAGVRVVKGFRAEEREAETFAGGVWRLFDNVKSTLTATALLGLASTILMGVASVVVLYIGGKDMLLGRMTAGDFLAFTLYLALLVAPVFMMSSIGSQLTEAFAGLDRMDELLREPPEDSDPKRVVELGELRGDIEFQGVSFAYEPGVEILHDMSFQAPAGSVTALVGSSGSGKSTLTGLAAAFAAPQQGRVMVDGVDLSTVKLGDYRSKLGVVLQESFLFDGTIRENIAFSRPGATQEEIGRAARVAYVDEFASRFEKGLDTVVGERGVKLSGGQRQRVSIARAILADPRVLILDEATSSLDSESEALIQQGLRNLMKGRTTFVIAHRLSTIRNADQILVIEGGHIVENGRHAELLARGGRYRELYEKQMGLLSDRFLNPGEQPAEPSDQDGSGAPKRAARGGAAPSPLQVLGGPPPG